MDTKETTRSDEDHTGDSPGHRHYKEEQLKLNLDSNSVVSVDLKTKFNRSGLIDKKLDTIYEGFNSTDNYNSRNNKDVYITEKKALYDSEEDITTREILSNNIMNGSSQI
jgi:hypothetical protein